MTKIQTQSRRNDIALIVRALLGANPDMDATRGLKSACIRALHDAGIPKADIARELGVSYGHVQSVTWYDRNNTNSYAEGHTEAGKASMAA